MSKIRSQVRKISAYCFASISVTGSLSSWQFPPDSSPLDNISIRTVPPPGSSLPTIPPQIPSTIPACLCWNNFVHEWFHNALRSSIISTQSYLWRLFKALNQELEFSVMINSQLLRGENPNKKQSYKFSGSKIKRHMKIPLITLTFKKILRKNFLYSVRFFPSCSHFPKFYNKCPKINIIDCLYVMFMLKLTNKFIVLHTWIVSQAKFFTSMSVFKL